MLLAGSSFDTNHSHAAWFLQRADPEGTGAMDEEMFVSAAKQIIQTQPKRFERMLEFKL